MKCSDVQEAVAVGTELSPPRQAHLLACPACGRVAAAYCDLDRWLQETTAPAAVPDGFADRVMAALPPAEAGSTLWGRPWVQVLLAHAAAGVCLFNVLRLVLRFVIPVPSFGGLP